MNLAQVVSIIIKIIDILIGDRALLFFILELGESLREQKSRQSW